MTIQERPHVMQPASATGGAVAGTSPCDTPGCGNGNAAPCAYRDRRQRSCGYSFCPDHQFIVQRQAFCRRHAAVVMAILDNPDERLEFPDLDNRALSLCEWVSTEIDGDMRAILTELKGANAVASVHFQPLRLVLRRAPYSRSWSRVWTLGDHTGTQRKLAIEVNEDSDTAVVALVDGNAVITAVPPWIADRGADVSEDAVRRRRDEFRMNLVNAVTEGAMNAQVAQPY